MNRCNAIFRISAVFLLVAVSRTMCIVLVAQPISSYLDAPIAVQIHVALRSKLQFCIGFPYSMLESRIRTLLGIHVLDGRSSINVRATFPSTQCPFLISCLITSTLASTTLISSFQRYLCWKVNHSWLSKFFVLCTNFFLEWPLRWPLDSL